MKQNPYEIMLEFFFFGLPSVVSIVFASIAHFFPFVFMRFVAPGGKKKTQQQQQTHHVCRIT